VESLIQDIRFGIRILRHNLSFSLLAVLCLSVGIGSNAAVYSWFEGILLRPFPAVRHQERMMAIAGTNRDKAGPAGDSIDLATPDFVDFRNNSTLFDWFIVDRITGSTFNVGDRAERATGSIVSANYFDAVGVRPFLGRGFQPDEDVGRNAHPVTVISYQMRKDRFNGAGDIIGRRQLLNGVPHTIIGVAPEGFYGTFVGWAMQFWVPLSMQETFDPGGYKLEDRSAQWIEGFVRLKQRVSATQAQAELSAIAKRLETDYPETNRGRGVKLFPLWKTPFNNAGALLPTLEIALGVVVVILLIVCANVSSLLLVKGLGRRHEMTIRIAIGSGRGRLVRQLLTESFVLSGVAAAGGLVIAHWCRNLLASLLPARGGVSMTLPGEIDWRVLALSAGACLVVTVFFALVPAIQTSDINVAATLRTESSSIVGGRNRASLRSGLVLVQIALSFVLIVGAALLIQSVRRIQNTSLGFSTNVMSTYVDLRSVGYGAAGGKFSRRGGGSPAIRRRHRIGELGSKGAV
jgi:putative ABC transport system permease protein